MILSECVIRFHAGQFKEAFIRPAFHDGWVLELSGLYRRDITRVTRQRGGDSIFKTIDAAWSTAEKIGFSEAHIELSGESGIKGL